MTAATYTYLPGLYSNVPSYFDLKIINSSTREHVVIPDVTGDGINDVIGAWSDAPGDAGKRAGAVTLYSGESGGWLYSVRGGSEGERLGISLTAVGDLNGDGIHDLLAGAPEDNSSTGKVRVLSGDNLSELYTVTGKAPFDQTGASLVDMGDIDGDGLADFAVSSHYADSQSFSNDGRIDVLSGADGSVIYSLMGEREGDALGARLQSIGDLNGDGKNELLAKAVGAPGFIGAGVVHIFSGMDGEKLHTFTGDKLTRFFGLRLASGDVNGDGVDDVAIMINARKEGNWEDYYTIHFFSGTDYSEIGSITADEGLRFDGSTKFVMADYDNDGIDDIYFVDKNRDILVLDGETGDLIIAHTGSYNGQLSVGDINGDGYADIITDDNYHRLIYFKSQPQVSAVEQQGPVALHPDPVSMIDNNLDELYLPRLVVEVTRNYLDGVDRLSVLNTDDIELRRIDGIYYQGERVGTVIGTLDGPSLTIALEGDITEAALTAMVQALSYEAVGGVDRRTLVQVTIGVQDGYGSASEFNLVREIDRQPVNDAPVIESLSGDTAEYLIGGSSVALDVNNDTQVSDIDSANFEGGSLMVGISQHAVPTEDLLMIANSGEIEVRGQDIFWQDTRIGSAAGGSQGEDLTVSLNSQASAEAVTALVQAIHYANQDAASLLTATKQLTVTLTDGDGGVVESFTEVSLTRAPMIDLNGNSAGTHFLNLNTEGSAFISIADAPQVSDDGEISTLTVQLFDRPDGAQERLSSQWDPGQITIDGQSVNVGYYNALAGSLAFEFEGGASGDIVEAVLESVRYSNNSNDGTLGFRTVQVTAMDEDGNSSLVSSAWLNVTDTGGLLF